MASQMEHQTNAYFSQVRKCLRGVDLVELSKAIEILSDARDHGKTVWIVGNGGSAATASHFANDLVKMAHMRALAVGDAGPAVLAFGNDEGWELMFTKYLDRVMMRGDVLVAISCSGSSENVLNAAAAWAGPVIVLTGNPGEGNELANLGFPAVVYAQDGDIRVQEDVHMAICHALAGVLRK